MLQADDWPQDDVFLRQQHGDNVLIARGLAEAARKAAVL
jgi:hypothetical protein